MAKVAEIYAFLDKIAPFKNQDKTDNSGLLVGDMNADVTKILVALDVTNKVASEAAEKDVDLIVAHHPLMFYGVKKINSYEPLATLLRENINFIATHTNLDVADGGVTDLMLDRLGLPRSNVVIEPVNSDGTGFGKITELERAVSAKELAEKCKSAFNCTIVRYVDGEKPIRRIGLCSGGGSSLVEAAFDSGCDAYVCGDLRWDRMVFAADREMTLIDAGHFHTEDIFCEDMVARLQEAFAGVGVEKAVGSVDVCGYVV